jgi:hypothetical protein
MLFHKGPPVFLQGKLMASISHAGLELAFTPTPQYVTVPEGLAFRNNASLMNNRLNAIFINTNQF